ncbi:thioredoxin, partial [Candidatus Bathyarchaeota archaeon]|nr:thioredoxin [Candidatus Bathyarchaeota archaeon]
DCWAPWCGPCNIVTPIIEELASDYAGKILFGKLNVDENRTTAIKYEIMSIPTLLVFKTGKLVDRIIGAMPKALLEPKITQYL